MDYALPRADMLPLFTTEISEVPSTSHPLGLRGGGEGGTTPRSARVVNAVVDALAELGVEHVELPATPERVWKRDANRAAACVIPVMPHESAARPTGCSRRDRRGCDADGAGRGGLGDSVQPLAAYHARDRRRARNSSADSSCFTELRSRSVDMTSTDPLPGGRRNA